MTVPLAVSVEPAQDALSELAVGLKVCRGPEICCNLLAFLEEREKLEGAAVLLSDSLRPCQTCPALPEDRAEDPTLREV